MSNIFDLSIIKQKLSTYDTFYVKVKFGDKFKIKYFNEVRKVLKVKLSKEPKKNSANIELLNELERLGIKVKILSGYNSRKKYLKVLKK
ncbi:MAG: hypothetical protein ACOCRX_04240 [Candidatus Woesearchaeota archaeon]